MKSTISESCWFSCIGLMLITLGCSKPVDTENASNQSTAAELPKVATVKPKKMSLTQKTEQPAKIEAFSMTRIHAKVNGFIDQILVDIGDQVLGPKKDDHGNIVEPGQLLAVLVAPELSDELAQKEAMIAQAEADIDQASAAIEVAEALAQSADANVAEVIAGQRKVEAEYQRWKSEAERISVLASTKAVTAKLAEETTQQMKAADAAREEVVARIQSAKAKQNEANVAISKAKADLRSIEAKRKIAQAEFQRIKSLCEYMQIRAPDLRSIEAKRKIAQAEFQRIKSLCEYMQIRAPYSGTISVRNFDVRNFDPGSLMQVSQANNENPLFTIVQTDRVRVSLNVPETEAVLVKQEGKAAIKIPALNNRIFEGKVARTSWVLSTSTRTLECEIEVENNEGLLRPGMYANVELIVAQ
ncbi:MAG: efflux RND transporter periplasmic adaptor subunit, partial [Pirellula sp.]|nr:efflux RND transporter periplasmic adaptor subunit [Pirellula sp.]